MAIVVTQQMLASLDQQITAAEQFLDKLKSLRIELGGESFTKKDIQIQEAEFTIRVFNALSNHFDGLKDSPPMLSDVASMSREELLRLDNFGQVSYREVWKICVEHGFWKPRDRNYRPYNW